MAACSSYSPVTCVGTCENAFYFHDAPETAVDGDSFRKSDLCLCYWVRSKDNKFLLLNSEQQFQVQNVTELDPDCMFKLQVYKESDKKGRKGRPTMLYVKNNGSSEDKNMVVACCGVTRNIYPEEMGALPKDIGETHHKALFYMTELTPSKTFQFESSVFPSEFLGFACDEENPSLNKLVLQKKGEGEVVDSCQVTLLCSQ
ncbi:uncharacterized protein [Cebidichthys violaceus]|uniref:uncharacterized protein isoform X2 n=1 Tax=Cebidichthys violaceus TaxID=271503 RepID=UPI0035CB3646